MKGTTELSDKHKCLCKCYSAIYMRSIHCRHLYVPPTLLQSLWIVTETMMPQTYLHNNDIADHWDIFIHYDDSVHLVICIFAENVQCTTIYILSLSRASPSRRQPATNSPSFSPMEYHHMNWKFVSDCEMWNNTRSKLQNLHLKATPKRD